MYYSSSTNVLSSQAGKSFVLVQAAGLLPIYGLIKDSFYWQNGASWDGKIQND